MELISKCDRVTTALDYVQLERSAPNDHHKLAEITNAKTRISTWKQSYWKLRKVKNACGRDGRVPQRQGAHEDHQHLRSVQQL